MNDFYYKGNIVGCREHIRGSSHINPKNCFCCGKEIKDGEVVVLLINNYVSFPNVLIHKNCFSEWESHTDDLCNDLELTYNNYKQLDMVFGNHVR